ncbi:MAG: 16S rRNA (uracil(1498)-N(3))-methyltransferase [Deferribacteraceae bacterium]|jgi:16S rRNA (uracil1498-N3)-methyltransferase|nr:16S rRNA (uracil(1498)-N(3))-methyltransferase [Deferribacteraceae bacterium]
MKRIYIPVCNAGTFQIKDESHHYLKNVLRAQIGQHIEILTDNELLSAEINDIQRHSAFVHIISRHKLTPPGYELTVFQALLKRGYMDGVVEKYAELGVTNIVPLLTEHSLHNVKDNSLRRYKEIAKTAALQSEQNFITEICTPVAVKDLTASHDADNILFYERALHKTQPEIIHKKVRLIIGPEGGFSKNEVDFLTESGFTAISPVSSILKAETAAVVFAGWVRIALESL